MRKVVTGAIAAAAIAWAPAALADDTQAAPQKKDAQRMQQPGSQSAATAPGHETAAKGTDESSRDMRNDTRADQTASSAANKNHFAGKKNFDMKGRVSKASAGEITIERKDGLPPATLKVGPTTKVEVDGKHASAAQLHQGQDVKASFNLSGGNAEAVEVKAKKASPDDQKKMQEQRHDNAKQQQKDAQKKQAQ